jgi:HAE1 family hydrophobic/amphiphilic exporter-1
MTACSTIAGMIPVAIGLGAGAETRAPMGTAIVGGMLTSTVLTLIVVPVVYSLMDDLAVWFRSWFVGQPTLAAMPQEAPAKVDGDKASLTAHERPAAAGPATARQDVAT